MQTGTAILAEQTPTDGGAKTFFQLTNTEPAGLTFTKDIEIEASAIESAVATSAAAGSATKATSYVTNSMAFLGVILSADQSGATLKFSQVSKLISRLRMVNINYGELFGTFLDQLGKSFDGEKQGSTVEENLILYKRRQKLIKTFRNGDKGKFDTYVQSMFLFGTMRENWDLQLLKSKKELDIRDRKMNGEDIEEERLLVENSVAMED